jgi:transporter family-2 protein
MSIPPQNRAGEWPWPSSCSQSPPAARCRSRRASNAQLATFIGGPIRTSAISFAVGTVVLVLLALAATRGVVSTGRLGSVPWWGWLGGTVEAGYVASTVTAAPRLGALNLFAVVIFPGQLLCSVVLDHFGVLYREHSLSAGRLGGVVLPAVGVALVRFY